MKYTMPTLPLINRLLLLTDGEEHSNKAEDYALTLAHQLDSALTVAYIIDDSLKRFTYEIYAVNRAECQHHLEQSYRQIGQNALHHFTTKAQLRGVKVTTYLLGGLPETVVASAVVEHDIDLVIVGAKHLANWWQRFASCNLPKRLLQTVDCSLLLVK